MRIALAVVVGLAIAVPSTSWAGDGDDTDVPTEQRMKFEECGALLCVTLAHGTLGETGSIARLFDGAAYEALSSGYKSTVVIRLWVYPQLSTTPVSFVLLQRQIVYGEWEDDYTLRFDEPNGRKEFKEKRKAEAFKQLTELIRLPVAQLSDLPPGKNFVVALEVELNPVSKQTLAEVRRWLSQGTGGGLDRGGAFFGSFVSVFVNPKIPEADRVLRVYSQPFYRARP